jgi:hypothetical protein
MQPLALKAPSASHLRFNCQKRCIQTRLNSFVIGDKSFLCTCSLTRLDTFAVSGFNRSSLCDLSQITAAANFLSRCGASKRILKQGKLAEKRRRKVSGLTGNIASG